LKLDYANLLADMGKSQEAVTSYKEYLEYKPNDANAYYNLGVVYQKNSQYLDAIDSYKKALTNEPSNINAKKELAEVLAN
jgi:tetratricopeptide (TPR) repeat protein